MFRQMAGSKWIRGGAIGFALLSWTTFASAYMIVNTGGVSGGNPGSQPIYAVNGLLQGDSFSVTWGGVVGINVTGVVSVSSLTNNTASISVALNNLSPPISGSDPRVTSLGLAFAGFTSIGGTSTGGAFLSVEDDSNFPGFTIDACATSGGNCGGGGNGGIPAGGSDSFSLSANGSFQGVLDVSVFALKVQGGPGGGSYELAGVPVPEPAMLGMLVLGNLLGMAGSRRGLVRSPG